jgi:hypothetical protein
MRDQFVQPGYIRPALWAQLKLVYDLSGGEYFYWFRLTQVVQAGALIGLFVHLIRPRSSRELLAVPLALAVLLGSHTFAWTVREAFPINTFLTVLLCCAAAAALASSEPRWWSTPAALLLFTVAALTVETGLLVWVILIGGYLVGWRGVSRGGVIGLSALLAGYFVLRFLVLDTRLPGLTPRDSGFGFTRYTPGELMAMFGAHPLPFYAYNVAVSVSTVLVGEPRNGIFSLTRSLVERDVSLPLVVGALASVLATAVVLRYAWRRRREWLSGSLTRHDRLVLLFGLVLIANAAICFSYTKDVIMSPAGFFLAAAVYVGVCDLLAQAPPSRGSRAATAVLLTALSACWTVRAVGLHAALDRTAFTVREQWAYPDEWLARAWPDGLPPTPAALKKLLQEDAAIRHPSRPVIREEWTTLFEVE